MAWAFQFLTNPQIPEGEEDQHGLEFSHQNLIVEFEGFSEEDFEQASFKMTGKRYIFRQPLLNGPRLLREAGAVGRCFLCW